MGFLSLLPAPCSLPRASAVVCSGIDNGKDLPREFLEYLYTQTVNHEIKMLPGGDGPSEASAPQAFVGEVTSSVYRALAHLCSLADVSSVHRKNFSRDVVACMLEDLWPDVMEIITYLAVTRTDAVSTEDSIAALSLNIIKYAVSAGLFLGMKDQVKEAAAVLEKVEARIMGSTSQNWQSVRVHGSSHALSVVNSGNLVCFPCRR